MDDKDKNLTNDSVELTPEMEEELSNGKGEEE